ncbi:MAG: hypothetical protein JRI35_04605 [Deltaproteobacteria bacterium]|nr:hypothetical protein [Deltaproteobacteria bacterium]
MVTDHRVLLLSTCSRPLFSEAFAARDPPRSPSLRSGAGVSHAAKAKKTCRADANRFQKKHPVIGYKLGYALIEAFFISGGKIVADSLQVWHNRNRSCAYG